MSSSDRGWRRSRSVDASDGASRSAPDLSRIRAISPGSGRSPPVASRRVRTDPRRAPGRRGRDDSQAGDARDRALLPEPVHGRDVVARVPDRLPDAERACPTSAPSARSCPTTPRRARAAREPLRTYESARPGRRLPDRRVLGRLRARARRPGRLPGAGGHPRRSPTSARRAARAAAGRRRRAAHVLEPDPRRARSPT